MLPEIIVDTTQNLAATFAARFEHEGERALAERGWFAIALSGGSLAMVLFPRLASVPFDWARTEFFWCDERAVSSEDPESNYGLARSLWLDPAKVPEERIHRMKANAADLEAAAAAYAKILARRLGEPPRLDLALLGVGQDGHVCSLFPDHPLLLEQQRWVAPVTDSPKPPPRRLTLTLPALAAAELVVIAAFGGTKARAVRAALEDRDSSLPVALVLRQARRVLLLLDPPAAGRREDLAGV